MSNWLVAVDDSSFSQWAFSVALGLLDPNVDQLYILTVALHLSKNSREEYIKSHLEAQEKASKEILKKYYFIATGKLPIKPHVLMGWSTHLGDSICSAIDHHRITHVVLGRRSLGAITRYNVGSSVRYVLDLSLIHI
eukprot:TRINITY_DN6860_c0_g1_i1.p1 TRINITY_DN6860_c0_g1~~TRINITY_DN6860_c0_g1_i1.p1  ORF type:complete len:137 (-),score=18.69 TRINITY_DN6860_c0_g1_i1:15-425(-)